eukprot:6475876-Amphidinium_carterae.1
MFDHVCWGQLSKAFANLAETQWEHSQSGQVLSQDDMQIMAGTLWTTRAPCALHDVHNAFKSFVNAFYSKKEHCRGTFVCASSCWNIALDCLEMLPDWLPTVVQCVENHQKKIPNKDPQQHLRLSSGCVSDITNGYFYMPEAVVMSGTYIKELMQEAARSRDALREELLTVFLRLEKLPKSELFKSSCHSPKIEQRQVTPRRASSSRKRKFRTHPGCSRAEERSRSPPHRCARGDGCTGKSANFRKIPRTLLNLRENPRTLPKIRFHLAENRAQTAQQIFRLSPLFSPCYNVGPKHLK